MSLFPRPKADMDPEEEPIQEEVLILQGLGDPGDLPLSEAPRGLLVDGELTDLERGILLEEPPFSDPRRLVMTRSKLPRRLP